MRMRMLMMKQGIARDHDHASSTVVARDSTMMLCSSAPIDAARSAVQRMPLLTHVSVAPARMYQPPLHP